DEAARDVPSEHVEHHLTDVVTVARVRRARVAEPDDEKRAAGHGDARVDAQDSESSPPSASAGASASPASPEAAPASAAASSASMSSADARGMLMTMTVVSGSLSSSTPSGSTTSEAR